VAEHYVPGVLRAAKVQKLQVVEMRDRLFATKFEDDGLMLSDKTELSCDSMLVLVAC
jgi:hypothetical protein